MKDETGNILLHQAKFAQQILQEYPFWKKGNVSKVPLTPMIPNQRLTKKDCPEHPIPERVEKFRKIIGSLNYLACWTRPDLCFAVSQLSQFLSNPGDAHIIAAKQVLQYLAATSLFGLKYQNAKLNQYDILHGYVNADWAGDHDTFKSTSGYVFLLNGSAISWKSKRQPTIALSTAEAEYMAASRAAQEAVYLRRLLRNLGYTQQNPTIVYEDNEAAIKWSESPCGMERARHIDLRKHFVHEKVREMEMALVKIEGHEQVADAFTKSQEKELFVRHRKIFMSVDSDSGGATELT